MRILIIEQLTEAVLRQSAPLISSADECWALEARNGAIALSVLQDRRWQIGAAPLFDFARSQLTRWVQKVMAEQCWEQESISQAERALVAYGLEVRLTLPAVAKAILAFSATTGGCLDSDVEVDLIAGDPYLQCVLQRSLRGGLEFKAVRVHEIPWLWPFARSGREVLAAQPWIRAVSESRGLRWIRSLPELDNTQIATDGRRHAMAFVLNQRFLDLLQPALAELERRGWLVTVVHYNPIQKPLARALAFAVAIGRGSPFAEHRLRRPVWEISDELLSGSPIPRRKLRLALNASWLVGTVQLHRHRWLLGRLRPDVVISFGPEIMSLALQGAARSLGIPSMFMAHGFQGPVEASWFFQATASAMTSQACVEANQIEQVGARRQGLVATGHPPYDAMLLRTVKGGRPEHLPDLGQPDSRPYLVLVFAIWSQNLLGHALNRRALIMVAETLPADAFLVCKLHPSNEEREMCEWVLGECLQPDAFRVVGERECSTPDLLAACHVAVANEYCMSLTDAVVMGVPAIAIRHAELPRGCGPLSHPATEFKDVCWVVENHRELKRALTVLTRDERSRRDLLANRKAYLDRFLVALDGRATQRVADLVEHLAAGGSSADFVPAVGASLLA